MRNPTSSTAGRPLAVLVTVALLSSLLVILSGVAPAAAASETVNFEVSSSATLEGSDPLVYIVLTRTSPLDEEVLVSLNATPGTASAVDYTLIPSAVTFPAGSPNGTRLPVPLTFTTDELYENPETLTINMVNVSTGSIGPNNSHEVTILNDDAQPTLSISDGVVQESTGSMLITITREGRTEVTATAVATPSSGTATADNDFASAPTMISIPPGGPTATETFTVDILSDDIYEPDETFSITLSGVNASIAGDDTGIGTIIDDDTPPTLSVDDLTVDESASQAVFTITRKGETAFDTVFDAATADISAPAGLDYTSRATTLTISPGGTTGTQTLSVPIADDDLIEAAEAFRVTITKPVNATISKATGTGTITDNDIASATVDVFDGIFVLEGDDPDTLGIVLNSKPTSPVTISMISPTGELAMAPTQVMFDAANWNVMQHVEVAAVEDGVDEDDPRAAAISFSVSSADTDFQGLSLMDVIATVGDADALLVTITGPSVGAPGLTSTFTATVKAGATGTVTYEWTALQLGDPVADGNQPTFNFVPPTGGAYIIQAIVGDQDGQNPTTFLQFQVLGDIAGHIFIRDIRWLAEEGITRGCNPPTNDQFCPNDFVTREQMAAFLVRFLGLTDDGGGNKFTDDNGSIFENDIAKLNQAGITKGCNPPVNTRFCPTDRVSREQMAAFLVRALALTDDGGGNTFTDDNGSIFENDIAKLATAGITQGCNPPDNTMFCPNDFVTRGQMAAFIHRADPLLNP